MAELADHEQRIAAALRGAVAGAGRGEDGDAAEPILAVSESLGRRAELDTDGLRQALDGCAGAGVVLAALPFGLATPLDRPRLRRDAYRFAAALRADEGTTLVSVAAALVAADLTRFDALTTAIRVRQSLLEDAPMALLNRLTLLDPERGAGDADTDPGAVLQLALSVVAWTDAGGVAAALDRLSGAAGGAVGALAGALAGAAAGSCDVPVDEAAGVRADRAAAALAGVGAATPG